MKNYGTADEFQLSSVDFVQNQQYNKEELSQKLQGYVKQSLQKGTISQAEADALTGRGNEANRGKLQEKLGKETLQTTNQVTSITAQDLVEAKSPTKKRCCSTCSIKNDRWGSGIFRLYPSFSVMKIYFFDIFISKNLIKPNIYKI